jgi:putative lipoprotein
MRRAVPAIALIVASVLAAPTIVHADTVTVENDPWFARDKYLHGSVSAALAIGAYTATSFATTDTKLRLGVGAGFALSVGIAKELWDLQGHGDPSWRDFTWDVMGTGVGLLASWLVDAYVFQTPALSY